MHRKSDTVLSDERQMKTAFAAYGVIVCLTFPVLVANVASPA